MFLSEFCPRSSLCFFFFNDTATTEIYTLSLHDALPIYRRRALRHGPPPGPGRRAAEQPAHRPCPGRGRHRLRRRSEEHTSELQSPCNLVCRLLLEKKNRIEVQTFSWLRWESPLEKPVEL